MKTFLQKDFILPLFWLFFFIASSKNNKAYQIKKINKQEFNKQNSFVTQSYSEDINKPDIVKH